MAKDLEVAIVFADVVGSTQLYDKFGDTKASATVAACLDIMKDATYQFNGTVIKTIGDEVMSTFENVDEAMGASVMMQTRISAEGKREDGIPVSIRIGCHYGPVVQEQNDIFGAAVHTANRMTSQAKSKQIVISGFTVEQMSPELRNQTRRSTSPRCVAGLTKSHCMSWSGNPRKPPACCRRSDGKTKIARR